eukprot:m.132093 g.132093  ORF g.132093 m.132093 type:complete len:63 (+) comp29586_c0_seq4:202-390(+)
MMNHEHTQSNGHAFMENYELTVSSLHTHIHTPKKEEVKSENMVEHFPAEQQSNTKKDSIRNM